MAISQEKGSIYFPKWFLTIKVRYVSLTHVSNSNNTDSHQGRFQGFS